MRSPFRRTINYCESLAKIGNCREVGQLRSWRRNVSPLIESSVEYLPCFTRQLHIIYAPVWNSQLPGIYVERQPQRNEVNVAKREGRTTSGGGRRESNKKTLKGRLTASSRRKEPKNANHSHPLPPPASTTTVASRRFASHYPELTNPKAGTCFQPKHRHHC